MISGNSFTYNGISSDQYGLKFLQMDTEPNKEIGGVLEYTTFKNNKNPKQTIQEVTYNDVFEYEVEMISEHKLDKVYEDENGKDVKDIDFIYKWLLNQPNYEKLFVENNDGYYYNCVFTNASYIEANGAEGWGIYGIKATMKCDSTFMWKDVKNTYDKSQFTYDNAELKDVVSHNNITDVREYTYPTLTIKVGKAGGDIIVQNISDNNRLTQFTGVLKSDTLTLSYFPAFVKSECNNNPQLVYESFNKKFFRLLQGINKIGIVGDIASITLEYTIGRLVR